MFSNQRRYLFISLLSVYSYLNIKFTEGDALISEPIGEIALIAIITGLIFFIWEGDRLIFEYLKKKSKKRYQPLLVLFLLSVLWITTLSLLSLGVQQVLIGGVSWVSLKLTLGFTFRVNLFLYCVNAIVYYQDQLKQAELQAERLKKEQLSAEFNALKRQVNPHFLFNSLNVLDSLVHENPEKASEFIEHLSTVYRYLTSNEENELVPLAKELDFIEDYIFLVSARYGENLKVDFNIQVSARQKYLPPAALQLVVENAIKHNEASKANPLTINIQSNGSSIAVTNTIQPKLGNQDSIGVGLNNIRTRYEFINHKIDVRETKDQFTVQLPLIEVND
ncbi:MAG: histidine kinase [Bacteroidota bacterium]